MILHNSAISCGPLVYAAAMQPWREVGEDVYVRRYPFYDQNIGVVVGRDAALVVDTRTTNAQAREVLDDLRRLTRLPVGVVVNTHGHHDHAFGNAVFRPAVIWAHEGCAAFLDGVEAGRRDELGDRLPDLADELRDVVIDLPDRTFGHGAQLDLGGRTVELHHWGRGHTDHDAAVVAGDVAFAGDLLKNGGPPFFGDAYPLEWPGTLERLARIGPRVVVPGHGDVADVNWVEGQIQAFRRLAALGRRVAGGELDVRAAHAEAPWNDMPGDDLRVAFSRMAAQLPQVPSS